MARASRIHRPLLPSRSYGPFPTRVGNGGPPLPRERQSRPQARATAPVGTGANRGDAELQWPFPAFKSGWLPILSQVSHASISHLY